MRFVAPHVRREQQDAADRAAHEAQQDLLEKLLRADEDEPDAVFVRAPWPGRHNWRSEP